jgi:dihydroflavonol-4-reductase
MRCFLTGATGFIGSHIARTLLEAGHEVSVLVRPTADTRNLEGLAVTRVPGDLSDEAALKTGCQGKDWVFHAAAVYTFWSKDKTAFDSVNVDGTRRLLQIATAAGVEKIVYTSSVAAVGAATRPGLVVNEDCTFNLGALGDPYVDSKKRAEDVVFESVARGTPVVIANPSSPFGPLDVKPTPTGDALVKFANGLVPFSADGGINVVDVRDVARGHLLCAEKGRVGRRYLLSAENFTFQELLGLFARVSGLSAPRLKSPYAVAYSTACVLEAGAKLLGKAPMLTRANVRATRFYLHYDNTRSKTELGMTYGAAETAVRDALAYFVSRGFIKPGRVSRSKAV